MKRIDLILILALAVPLPLPAACSGAGAGCCCADAPPPAVGPSFATDCVCEAQVPARVAEPALGAPLPGWMSIRDWPGASAPLPGGAGGKTAVLALAPAPVTGSRASSTPLLALLCSLRI